MYSNNQTRLEEILKIPNRHKDLAQLDLSISNCAFDANVYWCRLALNEKWSTNMHRHSFYELHFCLAGSATFVNKNNREFVLHPGEFVIFPINQPHQFCSFSEDFEKLIFGFDLNFKASAESHFLKDCFIKLPLHVPFRIFEASDNMFFYTQRLGEEAGSNLPGSRLTILCLLSELIVEIARIVCPNYADSNSQNKQNDPRLDALILFMRDNLSRPLTSEDFAAEFNMSVKQLNRLMLHTHHMSISAYFRNERIKKAKDLLVNTSLTTAKIAQMVGYSDEFSFNKTFKRFTSVTPGYFRSSSASDHPDNNGKAAKNT